MIPYPQVVETTPTGERSWDLYSRLLNDRIVFLGGEIDDDAASIVIAQMLFLEGEDCDKRITLYINSPGGDATPGLAIYDTMQYVRCPVETVCVGSAASIAAWILAAGTHGLRHALPNSRVLIHQPLGSVEGQATDIEVHAAAILQQRALLDEIMAKHTGKTAESIHADTERDRFLSAADAVEYGIIDQVMMPQARDVVVDGEFQL